MTDWRYLEALEDLAFIERILQLEAVRPEVIQAVLEILGRYLPEDQEEQGTFSGYQARGMFFEDVYKEAEQWHARLR